MSRFFTAAFLALVIPFAGCQASRTVSPAAQVSSQSVPINQVEDAAIWIHPTDPAKSLLLIANKSRGMELHDFQGTLVKYYDDGRQLAGVDVLYDFPAGGKKVDLVIAASPAATQSGVRVWQIDPDKDRITDITAKDLIHVLDDAEPLGLTAYHSRKTGACFFFVTTEEGKIEQYQLTADAEGKVSAARVRQFSLPGKVKAGVADDETGTIYFALEKTGVFAFDAEPTGGTTGELVIKINEHGLTPDLTGITLYSGGGGRGYLMLVSQRPKGQASTLVLFDRQVPHNYALTVAPSSGALGTIYSSSGIAVSNRPTVAPFMEGVVAAKNRINPGTGVEDYKLYSWSDIARQGGLLIDTRWSPRGP